MRAHLHITTGLTRAQVLRASTHDLRHFAALLRGVGFTNVCPGSAVRGCARSRHPPGRCSARR
jgi:hypothetical protein